jgi:pimeloyl-ACP methyl ester carboxylesterase
MEEGSTTKYAGTHGVRVAYDDRGPNGRGPTFLCLPGWCVNRGFFAGLADRLAPRHRVLTLDWRGHGESEPAREFGYSDLLDDALDVVEASGADSVIPIGQAHGAWVAVELRRRLGARVPAIVATSWLVLDPAAPFRAVLESLQDRSTWEPARDQLLSMWTAGASAEIAARVRREMGAYGFDMWACAGRSIAAEYARHGNPLRAIAALIPPPRFLHIFSQPKAPEFLAAQESFARDNLWFEVRRIEAISHFPPLEAPEAAAAEIERVAAAL